MRSAMNFDGPKAAVWASLWGLLALASPARESSAAPPEWAKEAAPLTWEGDLAAKMVAGCDRFLLRKIDQAREARESHWKRDFSSAPAYEKSVAPQRARLAQMLGVRDARVKFAAPELVGTVGQSSLLASEKNYEIHAVRWPVVRDVWAEGLLALPKGRTGAVLNVIALPDASQTPEQLFGLAPGVPLEGQFARRLAQGGCRVLAPALIDRTLARRAPPGRAGGANVSNREFSYRPAFEMGRQLIGYELQKILAGVDWFTSDPAVKGPQIATLGYGEGGLLALYAGALDTRINGVAVSGYFGPRERLWSEPLDRNVFGLLNQFGDAEIASLILPRAIVIDGAPAPEVSLPSEGGAPATIKPFTKQEVQREIARLSQIAEQLALPGGQLASSRLFASADGADAPLDKQVILGLFTALENNGRIAIDDIPPKPLRPLPNSAERIARAMHEIDRDTQWLLRESPYVRDAFMQKLYAAKDLAQYHAAAEEYREKFASEVIGRFDDPLLPPAPKLRKTYENPHWTGYEVALDVFPDVFAYGVLLVPNDLKAGEKRPVVVCQHGLEGRPTDVFQGDHYAYHDFAAKLCERGFITFAPQNIYIGKDNFRTLQRKANPLGKTLFSLMVPQHSQICKWLGSLPIVDKERIAFYGLSYGGKSAMRIPALVPEYCLSICSADFNEWVAKNASTRLPFSYVWTGEYEIFEWDLGHTFNYAEMAALICPRPFMVERGHTDGVSTDDWVAHEFARVHYHYSHRLKLGDRCELEIFDGPHTINGKGTFRFLEKHLR